MPIGSVCDWLPRNPLRLDTFSLRAPNFCKTGNPPMDLVRILIAILLPPLGVFLQEGLGKHFWINLLLTLLGYIPGIVHAVWIIARR